MAFRWGCGIHRPDGSDDRIGAILPDSRADRSLTGELARSPVPPPEAAMQDQNFIENEWRPARSGATDDIINPATERVIGTAPASDVADVDDAVAAAGRAFPEWAAKTCASAAKPSTSSPAASRATSSTSPRSSRRTSASPSRSWSSKMDLTLDNWRFFAAAGRFLEGRGRRVHGRLHVDAPPGAPRRHRIHRAVELPAEHGHVEGRARAAVGNTVVLKPSELTPYTALRLAELAADILPPVCSTWCAGGARRPASRSSPTQTWRWCRSPARCGRQGHRQGFLETLKRAPRARRQGAGRGVRRRRRRPSRPVRACRLLQLGQDCTAACRVIAGPKVHGAVVAALPGG